MPQRNKILAIDNENWGNIGTVGDEGAVMYMYQYFEEGLPKTTNT